jgi:thiol:disulfide interchange protein/DsbC/DsbD-like thiol-disulfide interchange protein
MRLHLTTLAVVLSLIALLSGCQDTREGSGPHVSVTLVADQTSLAPGSTFTLGVLFKPEPGWHIYWKNPGDSGLPPRFRWKAPGGITIDNPLWPYPDRIPTGPLVNYGYSSSEILLPFQSTIDSGTTEKKVAIKLVTEWLVCKEECLPGKAELSITLPVSTTPSAPSEEAPLFEKTYRLIPPRLDNVSLAIEEQEDHVVLAIIPLEGRFLPSSASFFPDDPKIITNAGPHSSTKEGDVLTITLKRDKNRKEPINRLRGVLVSEQGWSSDGNPLAVHVDTSPEAIEIATPSQSTLPLASLPIPTSASVPFVTAIIFALLGGFILNLMPCVFPVLSIKILSLIEQSKHDATKVKLHGIIFSLGVVASFWILAAIMLVVRAGGEQLGWGFQLQSPTFVAVMILLFFTLGLLFLSEISLGQRVQSAAGSIRTSASYLGSFFNGVLATAVATPCTAPFMSTSLAATLTLPVTQSLLVFTALGIGMSLPYLVLALRPSLVQSLPRPGAWMDTFKQLMAFPLFATSIWLLRVFGRQMGVSIQSIGPVTDLLWGVLLVAFALWLFSRSTHAARALIRTFLNVVAAIVLCSGTLLALHSASTQPAQSSSSNEPYIDSFGLAWTPYSEAKLTELTSQGKNIYIDFTAEWCITCQANKLVVFSSQEVLDALKRKDVVLVRGDWTSHDPTITAALARYGRNGVPLNVLIPKGDNSKAQLMPNILTPGVVLDVLKGL